MLEKELNRIANALERIADRICGSPETKQAAPAVPAFVSDPAPTPAQAPAQVPAKKGRPAKAEAPAPAVTSVTLDEVTDAVREVMRTLGPKEGQQAALDVLQKFGAGRIKELKPENYTAAHDALKALLK